MEKTKKNVTLGSDPNVTNPPSDCSGGGLCIKRRLHSEHREVFEVVSVLLAGERGTGFVDAFEFTVAHDLGIGVVDLQGAEQGDEGGSLGRRPGVGGAAFLIEASLVTDADGVGIVMAGMHADLVLITGLEDLTILFDVIVVADAFAVETGVVAGFEHFDSETLV